MGWAAAFVLIAFVLVMNVLAKIFAGRKRRQLEGELTRRRYSIDKHRCSRLH